jgi:hypothetical protein
MMKKFNISVHTSLIALNYLIQLNEDVDICQTYFEKLESKSDFPNDETSYDAILNFGGPELAKLFIKSQQLYDENGLKTGSYNMSVSSDLNLLSWLATHYFKFKPAQDMSVLFMGVRRFRYSLLSIFPKGIEKMIAKYIFQTRYNTVWGVTCSCINCKRFE